MSRLVRTYLTGIHPRSSELIAPRTAFRWNKKYNGRKLSKNDILRLHQGDANTLIRLQKKSGLSEIIDGLLNWNSILEPPAQCMAGIDVPVTNIRRWFNTNTFYHKPVVRGKIEFKKKLQKEFFLAGERGWKAILPGPFTFTSLVENNSYKNPSDLMHDFAKAENQLIGQLESLGCEYVQLDEPSLVYRPFRAPLTEEEHEAIIQSTRVALKERNVKSTVMTYFEDAAPAMNLLADMPTSAIGIDFIETSITNLGQFPTDKQLAAGCIDARNPIVEDPKWLKQTIQAIRKNLPRKDLQISLCPNTGLRYLPRPIADAKLRSMGKAAKDVGDS